MKPTDALADHFLKAAAIGAIYADANGTIGVDDAVRLLCPAGRVTFCYAGRRRQEVAVFAKALISISDDKSAAVAAIREAAAERMIGLTPHATVVTRARAAVTKVEQTMTDMQECGGLRGMNAEFKAAREAGIASSYRDFIHAKKLFLLEAMAAAR